MVDYYHEEDEEDVGDHFEENDDDEEGGIALVQFVKSYLAPLKTLVNGTERKSIYQNQLIFHYHLAAAFVVKS